MTLLHKACSHRHPLCLHLTQAQVARRPERKPARSLLFQRNLI